MKFHLKLKYSILCFGFFQTLIHCSNVCVFDVAVFSAQVESSVLSCKFAKCNFFVVVAPIILLATLLVIVVVVIVGCS